MGDNGLKDNSINEGNLQRPTQVQSGNGREKIRKDLPRSYVADFGASNRRAEVMVCDEHLQTGEDGCFSNTQTDTTENPVSDNQREQFELYGQWCRNCD